MSSETRPATQAELYECQRAGISVEDQFNSPADSNYPSV